METNCLLEIGVEELPASYIGPAMEQLRRDVEAGLAAQGLSHGLCLPLATPRRLALFIGNLPQAQGDRVERVLGPPESMAYDARGLPTKATQGFAAKQGVDAKDLHIETTDRGRYLAVEKTIPGRPTAELLVEIFRGVIPKIAFPKTMLWGRGSLRFARPIRWLVALLGAEVLPLTLEGLEAGRRTRGHRFLNSRADVDLERADLDRYREILRRSHVLVDPLERREAVREQVEQALGGTGEAKPVIQEGLVDIVANLVEWPTAMVGGFDAAFLEVPKEVLETAMVHHQRFFPVEDASGWPVNRFVFVANGPTDHAAAIIAGNERVLQARLADARFFFREDRKRTLE
jgi:glycyl-tRNA synthetase beta chain